MIIMSDIAKRVNQCRKPKGELGKFVVEDMNESHFELTSFGLEKIEIKEENIILDIGCGGGRTVNRLSKFATKGKVFGMDYSEDCVKWSTEYNKELIDNNKVEIIQASVEKIPFEDKKFDVITAVETIYFWPNLLESFKEVKRVLKDSGKFIIINEMYSSEAFKKKNDEYAAIGNMKILSPEELVGILKEAGFKNSKLTTVEEKNWLCCIS